MLEAQIEGMDGAFFLKFELSFFFNKSLIVLILVKGLFHGSIIVSVPPSHFFYQQNSTKKIKN